MKKTAKAEALLTVEMVADRLICSTKTVRRLIAKGDLKAVRIGPCERLVRVSEQALAVYLVTRNT